MMRRSIVDLVIDDQLSYLYDVRQQEVGRIKAAYG